ncbi:hypothetical protein Tco_1281926 [Tanacetum coccineum]
MICTSRGGHLPLSSIFASRERPQDLKDQGLLCCRFLRGIVNRADIDYAERIWEEFTQCIHSFIEDKMNLTIHVEGKKKVNPLVIPGVRFTKLIINHLQSRHRFHKRPGSPLHMPYDEYALGYLKFSFKNTKRVREEVSDDDAPPPKPAKGEKPKTTKKPTSTQQTKPKTKPSTAKTTKSTSSQPPKPKPAPAPAKPQEKKRKRVLNATEAPSQAKRSKAGSVSKNRTFQLRDKFIDEGAPATEPKVDNEEAIVQKVLEESMKDAYLTHRGPLPHVVFREPDSRKLQLLPEIQGKGKEKVGEEQAAQVLLNLQTPKKKNPAEQFIFQRRTPATAEPSGLVESSSLYAELGLTDSGTESDEEVSPEMNAQGQEEGQGGTNPGDAGVSQTPSSHVVHAGPNLDHMDLGIAEASSQPNTEQMDDEFTATAYPKVQENLKLPTEGEVRLEEPASSAGTLSSMKNLDKDLSFTDQFLVEKSQEDEPEKTNTEAEHAMRAPLRVRFKDLPRSDTKEILLQRMLEENYDKGHEDHKMDYEALQKSIIRDESSSKTIALTTYTAWTTTTSRLKPATSSVPEYILLHEQSDSEEQDMVSDDEDIGSRHIPKASALASSFVPPPENSLLSQTGDIGVFIDWFYKKQGITELTPEHLEGPAYEVVKAFHPDAQLNLTKPRWEATGLDFMHDYKIIDSPWAMVFRDKYGMQMIMHFNKIHKFSNGTLQQIDEALDYSSESSGTWKALLVDAYEKETTDFFRESNDHIFSVSFRSTMGTLDNGGRVSTKLLKRIIKDVKISDIDWSFMKKIIEKFNKNFGGKIGVSVRTKPITDGGCQVLQHDQAMLDFCKEYKQTFNDAEFNLYESSNDEDSEGV